MENERHDEILTVKGSENCDFKEVSSNHLPGGESSVGEKPLFFPFPFPPYDIQEDFMRTLFHVLDNGEVGIFESPTGTVGCNHGRWLRS